MIVLVQASESALLLEWTPQRAGGDYEYIYVNDMLFYMYDDELTVMPLLQR